MIAGPLLVMLIATENPVPQSLFTVYVTWHTGAALAGAAATAVSPAQPSAAAAKTAAPRQRRGRRALMRIVGLMRVLLVHSWLRPAGLRGW